MCGGARLSQFLFSTAIASDGTGGLKVFILALNEFWEHRSSLWTREIHVFGKRINRAERIANTCYDRAEMSILKQIPGWIHFEAKKIRKQIHLV